MRFLLSSVALAIAWTAGAQGTSEGIVSHFNANPVVTPVSTTAGWTFQPNDFVAVTELGCFNDIFLNNPTVDTIQVGLWTSAGALLASSSITPGSFLFNQSRYESITPVNLNAGQVYHIGAFSPGGGISVEVCGGAGPGGSVSMGNNFVLRATAINNNTAAIGFPPEIAAEIGSAYLAPNFRFEGRIPEPSSWSLLGVGALFLAARRRTQLR